MTVPTITHDFTVTDYHKMAEVGVLDNRVELIEGKIVDMAAFGTRHLACVNRLTELLLAQLIGRAMVQIQGSIRLSERSEPQPDVTVFRRREDFYKDIYATQEDALLVIEVSDTTLSYDRDVKVPLYARYGIPEMWLIDLNREHITVYRQPGPDGYEENFIVRGPGSIAPLAFPDLTLTAKQIFG